MRLLGLRDVPVAGQELLSGTSIYLFLSIFMYFILTSQYIYASMHITVNSEARARIIAERRLRVEDLKKARAMINTSNIVVDPNAESEEARIPINVILKADGVGTLQALQSIVEGF